MSEIDDVKGAPDIKTEFFEGPLDLLCYLIEKNKINIYDIPIITITDQYIDYMSKIQDIDLEATSSFLVMASTLLHIKSRMLLPSQKASLNDDEVDPREELVIKLLEYRRCKALATDLKQKHEIYKECMYKLPETPQSLGVTAYTQQNDFCIDDFYAACRAVAERNRSRFNDVTNRIMHILRREKISLKEKMKLIWNRVLDKSKVFFNEIFPGTTTSKAERVVGFLALLELLKLNRICVKQLKPFDVILIETNKKTAKDKDSKEFETQFNKEVFEEISYK